MANLAIKGHATRGKEVIEILEALGGKNDINYPLHGYNDECYYHIDNNNDICCINDSVCRYEFTLDEFLEKFPYKTGDKVQYKGATSCGSIFEVEEMRWEENTVKYTLHLFGCNYKSFTLPSEYLQPYKEETMEEKLMPRIDLAGYCKDKYIINLGNYEIKEENGKTYAVRKQPQYPKTYVECAKLLNCFSAAHIDGYKNELLEKLQELLICRDAYWKMGLGKPWEPDWTTFEGMPAIFRFRYNIVCDSIKNQHCLLVFPTEEMRDAFYENFKDLIEECKELL